MRPRASGREAAVTVTRTEQRYSDPVLLTIASRTSGVIVGSSRGGVRRLGLEQLHETQQRGRSVRLRVSAARRYAAGVARGWSPAGRSPVPARALAR